MERNFCDLVENVQVSNKISRREVDQLLEKVREVKTVSSGQSLVMILCCGSLLSEESNASRMALVQELSKLLENGNIPLDISHYNALLRVYWENEHRFSPTEFLAKLESEGVQPNRFTYQKLLLYSAANGHIKESNDMFDCMKKKGLKMNQYVLDLLIISNSKADELELATEILEETLRAKSKPSKLAFYTLLCGFARKSDIDYLCQIIETCKQKNIIMQEEGFIMILQALADGGHVEHIKRMEQVMNQYGYFMDDLSKIFSLISATKQFESFNRAQIIDDANYAECKTLAQSLDELMHGSEFTSNQGQEQMILIALKGFINQGLSISERLEKKLKELVGDTETTHIGLLARLRTPDFESNDAKSAPLKHNATETRLSAKELEEFVLEMEGLDMNVKELKLQLIRSFIRSNDHAKVVALLQKMEQEDFTIPTEVYEEVVEMYAMSEKLNEALEMMKKVRLNQPNFILNRVTLLRVAKYLFTSHRYGDTLRLLQENVPSGNQKEAKHDQLELDFVYIHAYWEFLLVLMEKCDDEQTILLPFVFAVTLIKEHLTKYNFNQFCTAPRKDSTICHDQSNQEEKDSFKNSTDVNQKVELSSGPGPTSHINLAEREQEPVADSKAISKTDTDDPTRIEQKLAQLKALQKNFVSSSISGLINDALCNAQKHNLLALSKIIDTLVACKRLSEATLLVLEILDEKLIPEPLIFKNFLKEIALNGDIETFDRIGELLPESVKDDFSFDKYYRSADMASGNVKKYLVQQLRSSRRFKSKTEAEVAANNFCIVGSFWGVKYQPELDGLLEAVGRNYAHWDVYVPFEVLWQHYIVTENNEKAEEIWEHQLEKIDEEDFAVEEIISEAEANCNESLCRKFLRFWDDPLELSEVPQILDCMINIMLSKKYISTVHRTMKKVFKEPEMVMVSNFQWYKACAEFKGMDVPSFCDGPPKA